MRACAGVLLFVFFCHLAAAGELTGEIQLARKYTRRPVAPAVYSLRAAPVAEHASVTANEMDRVAVILTGVEETPAPAVTATMNQRQRHFEPELLIVPVGSTVLFPNSDPVFHNIFSLSRPKSFDLGFYPSGQSRTVRFDREGIIQVYCHLHPNMHGAIVVVAGSRFTQPDTRGVFSFPELPAGQYELVVWHNTAGRFRRNVEIPSSGTIRQSFSIPLEEELKGH